MNEPTLNQHAGSMFQKLKQKIGPAIIVACIVLGPGSILTNSKIGCQFGFSMAWVLVVAGILMLAAIAAAARIGVGLKESPLTELGNRLGRPVAMLTGVTVFLIAACFQFGNNLGVLAGIEALTPLSDTARLGILVALNGVICVCLFGMKRLYQRIEQIMMLMMGLMLLGFVANLVMAQPSISEAISGLVPTLPEGLGSNFLPSVDVENSVDGKKVLFDPWLTIQGLLATTFSIAGAFYQAYLVREKGWGTSDLQNGFLDSVAGTSVLIGVAMMIMLTSATVLKGQVEPGELKSAADVALQLEPLFGSGAKWLFAIGLLAGASSSFLVNSVLGGTLLADGIGKDASLDSVWTKSFTVAALLIGMVVALGTTSEGRVPLIIFAQAMTVLGGPILIASLIYLGNTKTTAGGPTVPRTLTWINWVGAAVVIVLAFRTLVRIYLTLS
ncbi:Nramp family divalent metal transporter [Mariniblastus fucicola]|uniref:Divalent metal cation transporter MntH n=1 Tax=Mariniblastus fucicola TaxID=980251 RepID=A0A5B9PE91_9BACT|nr:Nramp family divalent metal transporter [Mariniblastus fucicola]QEG25027.1 Divalent metal cation transporter MntH [Mariniblastus fucicola]